MDFIFYFFQFCDVGSQSGDHLEENESNLTLTRYESKTRAVLHCGLAIYIKKYLKAKEEL